MLSSQHSCLVVNSEAHWNVSGLLSCPLERRRDKGLDHVMARLRMSDFWIEGRGGWIYEGQRKGDIHEAGEIRET